ncbi:kinetochore-associated protein NSL1 homolog [Hyperolius riggenbachi]|uniref:kinetochore-associated protein NSL1 homolog n=1 Tax=Hyperolius riggenbachi TaxID=752182 RepID=UPI0035A34E99
MAVNIDKPMRRSLRLSGKDEFPVPAARIAAHPAEPNAGTPAGRVTEDSGGKMSGKSGGRLTRNSGGKVTQDSGADVPMDSGGKLPRNSGGKKTEDSVGKRSRNSGGKVTQDSGADVPVDSGGKLPRNSGGTMSRNSGGGKLSRNSGGKGLPVDSGGGVTVDSDRGVTVGSGEKLPVDSGEDVPMDSGGDVPVDSDAEFSTTTKRRSHEVAVSPRMTRIRSCEKVQSASKRETGSSIVTRGRRSKEVEASTVLKERENVVSISPNRKQPEGESDVTGKTDNNPAESSPASERRSSNVAGPSGLSRVVDSEVAGCSSGLGGSNQPLPASGSGVMDKKAEPSRMSDGKKTCKLVTSSVQKSKGSSVENPPGAILPNTSTAASRDYKVHCTSKQLLEEVLSMCTGICKGLVDSQSYLSGEQKQQFHSNFVRDFESAFQENVTIKGLPWHDAPDKDSEPDIKILEDQLDDAMVDTALKRKRYPRKILGHFVKALKTEREILNQYKPVVNPEKVSLDPALELRMKEISSRTAVITQQIHETKKALPVLLEKAEGFSQVLSLQPVVEESQMRRDIFSSRVLLEDISKSIPKVLNTTPNESGARETARAAQSLRKRKTSQPERRLYPVRSKRRIKVDE